LLWQCSSFSWLNGADPDREGQKSARMLGSHGDTKDSPVPPPS
jgi:hypothetical protein